MALNKLTPGVEDDDDMFEHLLNSFIKGSDEPERTNEDILEFGDLDDDDEDDDDEDIESRFPNVFNFEDYTTDELVEIGRLMTRKQGFTLTEGAEKNMRAIIEEESDKPSPRFGNGRFVSNLLQNEILATLGARTAKLEHPTKEDLSTILPEDVIIGKAQKDVVFDDVAIDAALARLDALAGLSGVKTAIHNFVKSARYLHSIGEPYVGKGLLSWRFIGKSGTGKSTVAEKHIRGYISNLCSSIYANARTMKLMARAIYQNVILRESASGMAGGEHVVELADVEMLRWDGKKGKIGF